MSETQNKIDESVPAYAAPPTAQPAQPEEPARMNAMQRLVGTLFSPGETFRDINRKPTIVVAIILGMILAAAGGLFFTWKVKPDWDRLIRAQIQKQVDRSDHRHPWTQHVRIANRRESSQVADQRDPGQSADRTANYADGFGIVRR